MLNHCYRRGCGLELATFVFLVLLILYPNSALAEGHEDLSSCKVVLETIKFEEKPSCVKMNF